jgi:hypothetical protein
MFIFESSFITTAMKTLLLSLSGLILTLGLTGQTPITRADIVTSIGTTFEYRAAPIVSQGEGGENVTWDFSNLVNQGSQNYLIVDTTGLLGISLFEDPNLAWKRGAQDIFDYYQISNEKLQAVGSYAFDNSYFDYTNPLTLVEFPIDILDTYTDEYDFDYDLLVVTGNATGNIDFLVDGYGTLIMPWGTVSNAYRVKFTVDQTEVFDAGQGQQTSNYTSVNYSWYAPGFPGEIMRITDGTISVNGQEVPNQVTQYLSEFGLSIGEAESLDLKNFKVYPNPSNDIVSVQFDWFGADNLNLKVYDIRGRVMVQNQLANQGGGQILHTVDVSGLPAGYYLLVIESSEGIKTQKISKLR